MRIAWVLCISICAGQDRADLKPLTAEQRRLNLESFELVWKTVRDGHWDPNLGGVNWNAAKLAAAPKLRAAGNMAQARAAMSSMLGRLHQSHFAIIPGDLYRQIEAAGKEKRNDLDPRRESQRQDYRQEECGSGIEAELVEGHPAVTTVDPGSPAARAGVRPGWWIQSVGGVSLAEVLAEIARADLRERDFYAHEFINGTLRGPIDQKVNVVFADADPAEHAITLDRIEPKGNLAKFGFIPEMRVWFESSRIDDRIGYVRFNLFLDPEHVMPQFERSIRDCLSCDGFVIDLRGNVGGIGAMSMGMAGWFFGRGGRKLGTLQARDYTIQFEINPRPDTFDGPVAVLVDGATASTSEIFAEGLKDLGRARIFGTRTAGAALPSTVIRLPNGDGLQYAQANYTSVSGRVLEGSGVNPDVEVSLTRQSLLQGRDAVVDAAVAWIRSQKEGHD